MTFVAWTTASAAFVDPDLPRGAGASSLLASLVARGHAAGPGLRMFVGTTFAARTTAPAAFVDPDLPR
ncbi:MAG: hypothetical protein R3A79_30685 [Nannocystaceae bacterium]